VFIIEQGKAHLDTSRVSLYACYDCHQCQCKFTLTEGGFERCVSKVLVIWYLPFSLADLPLPPVYSIEPND